MLISWTLADYEWLLLFRFLIVSIKSILQLKLHKNWLTCSFFCRKLKSEPSEIPQIFIKGALIKSLVAIFGEIGGQTDFEVLKFDEYRRKGILKVPTNFAVKLRIALTLIADFQGIPSIFQVHKSSNQLNSLIDTFIEF